MTRSTASSKKRKFVFPHDFFIHWQFHAKKLKKTFFYFDFQPKKQGIYPQVLLPDLLVGKKSAVKTRPPQTSNCWHLKSSNKRNQTDLVFRTFIWDTKFFIQVRSIYVIPWSKFKRSAFCLLFFFLFGWISAQILHKRSRSYGICSQSGLSPNVQLVILKSVQPTTFKILLV